jgi:adenylylsulfate kinase-like enzyme
MLVSINGADNVGKTTQLGLLPVSYEIKIIGSLHDTDQNLANLVHNGQMKDWWWLSSHEEWIETIFRALQARKEAALKQSAAICLVDRGYIMFMAVAAAVIAIKDGHGDLERARTQLASILATLDIKDCREDLAILIKRTGDLSSAVKRSLALESEAVDERYTRYQHLLYSELDYLEEDPGNFRYVVLMDDTTSKPFRQVQDTLRAYLGQVTHLAIFQPLLHHVRKVYIIGGLSEAGKSTLAASICSNASDNSAVRVKLGYLCEQASARLGYSVYSRDEKQQAQAILQELDRYCYHHYWIRIVTLESAHRLSSTHWLKRFLDGKGVVVYLDTDLATRQARSLVTLEELEANDETKRGRGAHRVKGIADVVLQNGKSTAEELMEELAEQEGGR